MRWSFRFKFIVLVLFQFGFSSTLDRIYIFLAIILSIICGCMFPVSVLMYSALMQAMVDFGISLLAGAPENDVFIQSVTDFATYNCFIFLVIFIASYAATVLMNVSAFNQVASYLLIRKNVAQIANWHFGNVQFE